MLHLYEATVCTKMMVVAKTRNSAIKTAKMYIEDEVGDGEYSTVSLADINHPNKLPSDWEKLYPYIANKCIDRQMTCRDLVEMIRQQTSDNPPVEEEEPSVIAPTPQESQDIPVIQPQAPSPEPEVVVPNKPSKEDKIPQPGRGIKSPKRTDLPPLRF